MSTILIADDQRRKEQDGALRERQELLKQIEEYKRLEAEQLNELRLKNKNYQEDLVQQLKFQQRRKDQAIDETRREIVTLQVLFVFSLIHSILSYLLFLIF